MLLDTFVLGPSFTIVESLRGGELQQNTPEWDEWRHKGIGASDAKRAISKPGRKGRAKLLAEKRAPEPPQDSVKTKAMDKGAKLEKEARRLYNARHQTNVRPVCVQSNLYPWLRASLDGLSDDGKLVVEIKCGERVHQQALKGFPSLYRAQVQHILAVTGWHSLDFWCYWPESRQPEKKLIVWRDQDYIDRLLEMEGKFWSEVSYKLDLSGKQIEKWSQVTAGADLSVVANLDLGHNRLTALPPEIGDLTALTSLNLNNNRLTELPPEIGNLKGLTSLNINFNQVAAFPPEFSRLKQLTSLSMGGVVPCHGPWPADGTSSRNRRSDCPHKPEPN